MKSAKKKTSSTNATSPQHKLTPADIAGFANTLDVILDNEEIPEHDRLELSRALDSIADLADAINPLTPRAINRWLSEFLGVDKPEQTHVESASTRPAIKSTAFDGHDLEGPLQRIICNLALDDDWKCEAFIRLIRLIDLVDDDARCVITSLVIDFAYASTTNHRDSLKEYLTELSNDESGEYAGIEDVMSERRSNHASEE